MWENFYAVLYKLRRIIQKIPILYEKQLKSAETINLCGKTGRAGQNVENSSCKV